MRIVGYTHLLAAACLSAMVVLEAAHAVEVREENSENSEICTGAAGSETQATYGGCESGSSPSRFEANHQSIYELGVDNFEYVVGGSPWTFVLLYDRLDLQSKETNDAVLEKLVTKFASRALPKISFAKMDMRQHSYYRNQYMDYEGGKGHFIHQWFHVSSTIFMSVPDEKLYWPSQWTLFGSDFNVYGIMPLDPRIVGHAEAIATEAERWIMPLAGKFCPGVRIRSATNNERYRSERSAENVDNTFRFSCKDDNDDCSYWAVEGECESADFSDWMHVHCSKSCGFCHDSNELPKEEESSSEPRYITGSDEDNGGFGFYRYNDIHPSSLVRKTTAQLMNRVSMLSLRYLTWCVSYEEFWEEERKQREDRQTNYGFYLDKMNAKIKALFGATAHDSSAERLNPLFQEMLFGYGRSHSTIQKYIEDEILDTMGPDVKTIVNVDIEQITLLNQMSTLLQVRDESIDHSKKYFIHVLTNLSAIMREFQESLSKHYLDYRKTNKSSHNDFELQRMDVLDMSDPKDFAVLSSYDEFERRYTARRIPAVLANAVLMDQNYTFDFLVERCGHMDVTGNVLVGAPVGKGAKNRAWGGLTKYSLDKALMNQWREENGYDEKITLEQFLVLSKELDNLYLHDFSLTGNCDRLFHENTLYDEEQRFRLPSVIGNYDLFQKLTHSPYQLPWPSLFIGRKGSNSKLHVDAGGSGFLMYLVSGRKRWVVFDAAERPFLYERTLANSFIPDVLGLNKNSNANHYFDERFPLLRRAAECGYEVIQEPGQLVYIPPNTPHAVENLEDSVGVALNFMPRSGVPKYLHDLVHSVISPSFELTLRYMIFEGNHNKLVESKDPLYTTLAEYRAQL